MSKKILFLSKDNLTTNPRLLKELKAAVKYGYDVDFLGFNMGAWSDKVDLEITKDINANFNYISITKKPFFQWFISSIIERISRNLFPFFKKAILINAYAHSKRTFLLRISLKGSIKHYDLIIAHTLPTLYPAYKLSKKLKTSFIFDIEDYHPGEKCDQDEKQRREFLMTKLLPEAKYITFASPLIGKQGINLLKKRSFPKATLINNCFSENEFKFQENKSEKIKFVWFSQNISHARGLELIVPAIEKFKDKIQLTLIGNLYKEFYKNYLYKYSEFIDFVEPLSQKQLNLKLSEYDIGLAIELNSSDFNRNICLTNKIFAYTQAGLYVLATDTEAQQLFITENPEIGLLTEQDTSSMKDKIEIIINEIEKIRSKKESRFNYAKSLSWEKEESKIIDIIKKVIL